jgi:protein kinase A
MKLSASQIGAAILHPTRSHSLSAEEKRRADSIASEHREQEKQFIANFSENQHPLPPSEVAQDSRNKQLGHSSRGLSVKDFDLIKTLGTGTFARVWLVRLAQPAHEDRNKVFALKVLRKAEGK